jgi:hypothetical protein
MYSSSSNIVSDSIEWFIFLWYHIYGGLNENSGTWK